MVQLVVRAVFALIQLLNLLIFVRCILSFIPQTLYTKPGHLVVILTEPILAPCRKLLMRFEFARNLPLDFSPLLAWLLLGLLSRLVYFFVSL